MTSIIQKLINDFYRYPRDRAKEIKRFGGKAEFKKMLGEQEKMQKSVRILQALPNSSGNLRVHFLTGKKYIDETLFCIFSLEKQIANTFKYVLVDDGTFGESLADSVKSKIPNVEIVLKATIDKNIEKHLPVSRYPILNKKRQEYPHIKKLTDIHTIGNCNGYKLVLDSDMLFYHPPKEIKSWLKKPQQAIHMVDCGESYGYSHPLIEKLCGAPIPKLVNVGIFGIDSNEIEWNRLERWTKELEEAEGASYYLEQALSAMLIAGKPATILDKEKYRVNPSEKEIDDCKATLHHYVDLSKKGYYTKAWKKFV